MKTLKLLSLTVLFILGACSSVRVNADFDKNADFGQYKTYAFQKNGIDKAEISDLDKKRILRAIDSQMQLKGLTKSESPDLLINIFTKEQDYVNVGQFYGGWGYGWGWGYGGWGWGRPYTYTTTEGTLFIDLIDAKKNELIWQGSGVGSLTQDTNRKDERINEFVSKILSQYPPEKK